MAFSTPRQFVLGLPSPSRRVCADGRTYGCTDVRTDGHVTITSQPKFLGSIGYQISFAMELRWRALPAGSATTHCRFTNDGLLSVALRSWMSFLLVKMGCRFLLIFAESSRKSLLQAKFDLWKAEWCESDCPLSLYSLSVLDLDGENGWICCLLNQ